MIVVGCVLLVTFFIYDTKFAKVPILSKQFIKNKSIVAASWIGFLDFVSIIPSRSRNLPTTLDNPQASFYITFAYLYSFVIVVKPWYVTDG